MNTSVNSGRYGKTVVAEYKSLLRLLFLESFHMMWSCMEVSIKC